MKYKPGDKVRIKSIDWYNENKDETGRVMFDYIGFCKEMTKYCGAVLTIMTIGNQDIGSKQKYFMHETDYAWGFTDDMIEGLVDEEPQDKMISLNDACEWIKKNFRSDGYFSLYYLGGGIYTPEKIAKDFRKSFEG